MFHREHGGYMLLQGHHLQELSPQSHEQRAELSQVHVYQLRQLVGRLGLILEKQKHLVIKQTVLKSETVKCFQPLQQSDTPPLDLSLFSFEDYSCKLELLKVCH